MLALTAAPSGSTGVTGTSPKTGVLASKTTAIPSLSGPHGCVRSSFKASVKSAGVRSVGFYMDKRKLKSMTAKSARKGRLTITINPSTLSVGSHKLTGEDHDGAVERGRQSQARDALDDRAALQLGRAHAPLHGLSMRPAVRFRRRRAPRTKWLAAVCVAACSARRRSPAAGTG